MNWLDITIAAIIALFTLIGIARGLVSQIFSIAALLGGLAIGFIFYDVLGGVLIRERVVENESVANVGGFVLLALAAYVIIQTAGWLTTRLIGTLHLSWLNRISGGAVGAVMGAVTAFLLSSCLSLFYTPDDPVFKRSALLPYLNEAALIAKDALPGDFEKSFNGARDLVRKEGLDAAMKIKDSDAVREILNRNGGPQEKKD